MPTDRFDVQYAALGLLLEAPRHGYALRARLESELGTIWRVASSQLYAVLRRLEASGWVRSARESSELGPGRRTYAITDIGERAFWAWCLTPAAHLRDLRVELLAKLYFLRRLRPDEVGSLLAAQRARLSSELRRILSGGPELPADPSLSEWATAYRCGQLRQAIEWLDAVRRPMEREGAKRCAGDGGA